MTTIHYAYRRRHPTDRHHYVGRYHGSYRCQRDDAYAWVVDYRCAAVLIPERFGRNGNHQASVQPTANPCELTRLWLWPERPLRVVQFFTASKQPIMTRIDFATKPQRIAGCFYQTDLYLDLFVGSDNQQYVIQDEDELAHATEIGFVSSEHARKILHWCNQLVRLVEDGRFGAWLAETCPNPVDGTDLERVWQWIGKETTAEEPDGWPANLH